VAYLGRVAKEGGHHRAVDDQVIAVEDHAQRRQTDHPRDRASSSGVNPRIRCVRQCHVKAP